MRSVVYMILPGALVLAGCSPLKEVAEDLLDRRTPRERYEEALIESGLGNTALVADWNAAAARALRDAPMITAGHSEDGFFHPAEPVAVAYRVRLRRGQKLTFELQIPSDSIATVFVDAWQVEREGDEPFSRVAVADSGERFVTFGPRRDGEFVVRAQPELLRGGRFTAVVRVLPTLAFPVQNGNESDVGSRFGDERDGGRRSHHGIDIFAPRGTPVLAAAPGRVQRVQTTPVGGNVVWMRDTSNNRLYYAHLDRHYVEANDEVEVGDTIGFVGNTGNARTTPPHLHFGVYSRGPVDPWFFVHRPRYRAPVLAADTGALGEWTRTSGGTTVLRAAPSTGADSVTVLPRETILRVVAATGPWYRVRLPDGITGYVAAASTEPASSSLHSSEVAERAALKSRPALSEPAGDTFARLAAGTPIDVLGRYGQFMLVRNGQLTGWMDAVSAGGTAAAGGNSGSQR